jgi:hypothetical protein
MKTKKLIYGLTFIVAAVLLLLVSLDLPLGFVSTIPVADAALALLLLILCIKAAIIKRRYWVAPFFLAFIFLLLEQEIAGYCGITDGNIISNWTVLLCAFLLSAGIGLITTSKINGNSITLSSHTKYINCSNFKKEKIKVMLGSAEVYFDNIENYSGGGVLDIQCTMGNLEIRVPSSWNLVSDIETKLGNTEVMQGGDENGPLITIKGVCQKGNVEIWRV